MDKLLSLVMQIQLAPPFDRWRLKPELSPDNRTLTIVFESPWFRDPKTGQDVCLREAHAIDADAFWPGFYSNREQEVFRIIDTLVMGMMRGLVNRLFTDSVYLKGSRPWSETDREIERSEAEARAINDELTARARALAQPPDWRLPYRIPEDDSAL